MGGIRPILAPREVAPVCPYRGGPRSPFSATARSSASAAPRRGDALSGITAEAAHDVTMHASRDIPVRGRRRGFWDRWTTRLAVIGLLVAVVGGGLYANVASVPGYAPWQDKASTLLRQVGFGRALDAYQ